IASQPCVPRHLGEVGKHASRFGRADPLEQFAQSPAGADPDIRWFEQHLASPRRNHGVRGGGALAASQGESDRPPFRQKARVGMVVELATLGLCSLGLDRQLHRSSCCYCARRREAAQSQIATTTSVTSAITVAQAATVTGMPINSARSAATELAASPTIAV